MNIKDTPQLAPRYSQPSCYCEEYMLYGYIFFFVVSYGQKPYFIYKHDNENKVIIVYLYRYELWLLYTLLLQFYVSLCSAWHKKGTLYISA